jgi:hypothetical protein
MHRRTLPPLTFRPVLGLLALGALGLGLTSCGNRLNTSDVEATIKADIERQGRRLALKAVLCPSDVTRQAGAYFRCVGELEPEGTFTINVTQTDSQGNVTWDVPNSKALLNLPKVEDKIQQELSQAFGQRALLDCGTATYRVNQPGDRFQCQVVGGLATDTATVDSVLVRIGSDGNLSWQELTTSAVAGQPVTTAVASPGVAPGPVTASPSAASTSPAAQIDPAIKTTTVTGPTGRVINRPYIRGDSE